MRQCVILGAMPVPRLPKEVLPGAFVIAADAGVRCAKKLGLKIDIAVGDWDSATFSEAEGAEIITLPHEKDDTDLYFAARLALERGFDEVVLLGGIGGRLDHTVSNFGTLRFLAENGARAWLVDEAHLCTVVVNGTAEIPRQSGAYLSVFSLDKESFGVTLTGVYYPLKNAVLSSSYPIGTSNEFVEETACVTVSNGALLVIRTALS